jgi:hypothetical protein
VSGRQVKSRVLLPLVASLLAFVSSPGAVASLMARSTAAAAAQQAGDMFLPYMAIPVGAPAQAVAVGDLNDDGLNDVAVVTSYVSSQQTSPADYALFVFIQEASGQLRAPRRYAIGGTPGWDLSSVDIGDVNGDGRDDVVVARYNGILILLQNASGTLNAALSYSTPDAYRVQIGDFNSDGRLDVAAIAYANSYGGVSLFTAQPNGTFALVARYTGLHSWQADPEVGDVNGDGRDDLVITSDSSSSSGADVFVYLQQPGAWLSPARSYDVVPNDGPDAAGVGDVNGDGRDDVAVGYGYYPASVATWLQTGAGLFGTLSPRMPTVETARAMAVADLDADGRSEVIVVHDYASTIGVYWQAIDGALSGEELYTVPSSTADNPQAMDVGDVNNDGVNDIVFANSAFGLVVVPRNPARSAPARPGAAAPDRRVAVRVDHPGVWSPQGRSAWRAQ